MSAPPWPALACPGLPWPALACPSRSSLKQRHYQRLEQGCIAHWPAILARGLAPEVETLEPYSLNTVAVTTNDEDMWAPLSADPSFDPFPQFVYLGDDVSDGLFAWIQIGINSTADYQDGDYYGLVGYLDAEGGHAFSGGSGIGGGGSGATPSGAAPTGVAPSSSS
ncbi:hypothetical protein diail_9127 [Diaporthe ilicicola]|nr:hypothetical protein diail_9127 [Diaporthe ilicicola]